MCLCSCCQHTGRCVAVVLLPLVVLPVVPFVVFAQLVFPMVRWRSAFMPTLYLISPWLGADGWTSPVWLPDWAKIATKAMSAALAGQPVLEHFYLGPGSIATPGRGALQACFPSPHPPLLGSWGWAQQSELTHIPSIIPQTHSPPPPPLGKGAAAACSDHLPPNWGRGLPLVDAPSPEMFSEACKWLREAFGRLLLLGPEAGHKAHHTCTPWYAYVRHFQRHP